MLKYVPLVWEWYGLETVTLTKRQEAEMEVALGVTRMDKIRNEYIRGTAQVGRFGEKTRESRLRWYGHVRRKDDGYIGKRMLRMELPGKRKRGRPERMWWNRTWLRLKWQRRMQKIGTNGDGKSAVATPDGRIQWKKTFDCEAPWLSPT